MKRLIWLAVMALGGGGIFYAVHPHAKDCESLVKTANVAVDAVNNWQPGDDANAVLSTLSSTAAQLGQESTSLHSPFNTDASAASQDLQQIVYDLNAGNETALSGDEVAFNAQVQRANDDCRQASGNVDG